MDGDNDVYMMLFSGGSEVLLGRSGSHVGKALVKVGRSNDPRRRLGEVNSGFPKSSLHRWKLDRTQKFPDGKTPHELEDIVKREFDKEFVSQGGEFFTGDLERLRSRFQDICISRLPKILGAPGKAKGV